MLNAHKPFNYFNESGGFGPVVGGLGLDPPPAVFAAITTAAPAITVVAPAIISREVLGSIKNYFWYYYLILLLKVQLFLKNIEMFLKFLQQFRSIFTSF